MGSKSSLIWSSRCTQMYAWMQHNHNCLAGVEGKGNQCYCGHHIRDPGARLEPASSHCDVPCSGDRKANCGGNWAVDIFNITCAHPLPPNPLAPPAKPPTPAPPEPPVRDWRFALHCNSASMRAHLRPLEESSFDCKRTAIALIPYAIYGYCPRCRATLSKSACQRQCISLPCLVEW